MTIETPEEAADRIAKRFTMGGDYGTALKDEILSALRNERERCAETAEDPSNISMVGGSTGDAQGTSKRIARAIREGR